MTNPASALFVFGEYELDCRSFELRQSGSRLKLEPKVFDLLALLVSHRDRVVTTRELFDALWPGEFVTPSALSRCVMEARRATGDDGVAQRVIKTVHGRGYRFVAPVDERTATADDEDENDSPVRAEVADVTGAAIDDVPLPTAVAPGRPVRHRRAPFALAAVVLSAAVLDPRVPARTEASGDPGVTKPVRLAFLPVSTAESDAELQLVSISMADLLQARLSEIPEVIVRTPEYATHVGLRAASLVEFARRTGVSYVVTGSLERRPARKGYLTLTLHQIEQPPHLRDVSLGGYDIRFLAASTDLSAFLKTRDVIVSRIVDALLPAIDIAGAERNAPANADAYRLYLLAAGRVVQQVTCDETARELAERSLALDPAYPRAWMLLGWAHYNEVGACGQDGSHYDRALEAARKAAALAPGLPEPTALTAAVLTETGRVDDAYDLLLQARARFPSSPEIRYALAYALTYAGFLDRASEHLEALLALDPMYLTSAGWTPNAFLYRRQWDRFLALLPGTEAPLFRFYRGFAEYQSGRPAAAEDAVESAFRLNPQDVFGRLSLALRALVRRDAAEARNILLELSSQREARGSRDGEFTYKQAQLLSLAGDRDGALVQLDRAIQQGFFCDECIASDPTWRACDTDPKFRAVRAAAKARHLAFGRRFGLND